MMKDVKRNRTLCKCLPQNAQIYSRMKDHTERLEALSLGRQVRQPAKSEGEPGEEAELSRRQQKLKRKQERAQETKKMERAKTDKPHLCDQEATLSNFLESMHLDNLSRVACRVDEARLGGWGSRIAALREVRNIRPLAVEESPSKKKKGRR